MSVAILRQPRGEPVEWGGYRWRLWNFRGWYEEGYLPLRTVSFGWKRNGVAQFTGSLPLHTGAPPVRSGEHVIFVEKYGVPIGAYPIWSAPFSTDTAYVTLNGSDWGSYLKRRRVRVDREFRGEDQFDIVRGLLSDSQAAHYGYGDLVIRWAPTLSYDWGWGQRSLSGVYRDRTYNAVERKELYEMIDNLSNVIGGFDWRIHPEYISDNPDYPPDYPILVLELLYPREGFGGYVEPLEYKQGWPGSNVANYSWNENAGEMANITEAANDEDVRWAWDWDSFQFYPCLEAMDQRGGEGGVTNTDTLQSHADALLAQRRRPIVSCTVETTPHFPGLHPDMIGSQTRFRATSWRHPAGTHGEPGLDMTMTIDEVMVNAPNDERSETGNITMSAVQGGRP